MKLYRTVYSVLLWCGSPAASNLQPVASSQPPGPSRYVWLGQVTVRESARTSTHDQIESWRLAARSERSYDLFIATAFHWK